MKTPNKTPNKTPGKTTPLVNIAALAAMLSLGAHTAQAQPAPAEPRPERALTPEAQAALLAFDALPEATRKQIQDDLIWASNFTAVVSGQHGPRTHNAILNFQRNARVPANGILDDAQRRLLSDMANRARTANRLTIQADPRTGASLPIAGALFTKRETLPTGTRWESADGEVVLETGIGRGGAAELPAAFDRFVNLPAPGRRVTYKLLRPDFFVVSGDVGDRSFYVRYAVGPNNLRGYALSYPAARAKSLERHVISIANGFQAVPGAPPTNVATTTAPGTPPGTNQPPGGQPVQPTPPATNILPPGLMLTGIVTAPGKVQTAALAAACNELRINGKPARLIRPGSKDALAELEGDTGSSKPLSVGSAKPDAEGDVLVIGFAAGARPTLSVTPALVASASPALRITMPLAREGGGALVLNRAGNLVGVLQAPRAAPRLVAGFVPAPSHAAIPAQDLAKAATAAGNTSRSAGAIAAAVAPSLVAISCAQPVTLPRD